MLHIAPPLPLCPSSIVKLDIVTFILSLMINIDCPDFRPFIMVFCCVSPIIVILLLSWMLLSLYIPLAMYTVPSDDTVPVAFLIVALGPLVPFHTAS